MGTKITKVKRYYYNEKFKKKKKFMRKNIIQYLNQVKLKKKRILINTL